MRLAASLLLFLLARICFGAQGDIIGVEIQAGGDRAKVWVEKLNTNGNFWAGFGTNNSITSTSAFKLTLTSMGFDSTATPITRGRTIWGTKILRLPYGRQLTNDIQASGSDAVFSIWLSDFIYAKDSNITATVLAGAFSVTNGSGTNSLAAIGLAVTNSSTLGYPKPVANWSWPRWTIITNRSDNQYTVRAVGFERHAPFINKGTPLACMKFWAMDDSGNVTPTNIVSAPVIDKTMADLVPVVEYVGQLYYTNLNQASFVSNQFAAYPFIGDAPLTTDDAFWTSPTPLYSPLEMRCNRFGTNFGSVAVVSTNGNDATGWATNGPLNIASSPAEFATLAGAMQAIVNYNSNWFGHKTLAGGTIYLRENGTNWNWKGTGGQHGTNGGGWFTITLYPGVAPINAYFQENAANWRTTNNLCLDGILLRFTNNLAFDRETNIWFRNCILDSTVGALPDLISTCALLYFTGCTVSNWNQGLRAFSTEASNVSLVRSCDFTHYYSTVIPYTLLGNKRLDDGIGAGAATGQAGFVLNADINGQNAAPPEGQIWAYNWLCGLRSTVNVIQAAHFYSCTNGWAFVQNVYECPTNSAAIAGDFGSVNTIQLTNAMNWYENYIGFREFVAYNDSGSAPAYRWLWSVAGCALESSNWKTDIFTSGNANRVGNWPQVNGVGCTGNASLASTNQPAAGAFMQEFPGIHTYQASIIPITGTSSGQTAMPNPTNWVQWVDLEGWYGGPNMAGNGNYKVQSFSPLNGCTTGFWCLPYDLGGNCRSTSDPPGAYCVANPRKGGL